MPQRLSNQVFLKKCLSNEKTYSDIRYIASGLMKLLLVYPPWNCRATSRLEVYMVGNPEMEVYMVGNPEMKGP